MMKAIASLLLIAAAPAAANEANPLGKVIELMDSLSAKITKQGEVEAKAYAEFVEWCDDASKNTRFEITTAESLKAKLEATIAQSASSADVASAKIDDLAAAISTGESDLKAATGIRVKEAADFSASEAELVDAVDTLNRAISTLSKEMAKNPAAFAQVDTSNFDKLVASIGSVIDAAAFATADKQKLTALLQSQSDADSDDDAPGAPAAAVYKSHSGNIVEVLEDMKEKAEEQLGNLRKAEGSAKHNFQMLKQSLEDQLAADNKDMSEQKAARSAAQEAKAVAEGDLATTVKALANANKALQTANSDCMTTAADHEATVAARTEELKVVATAKGILSSTTSGAVEQSYSMLQLASKLNSRTDLANTEVAALVKKLAKEQHSAALAQLASRIAAVARYGAGDGEDVFSKIKGLISGMIAKLEKEAQADANEKAYCDEQMAKTEAKQSELEDDVAKLTAKIDQQAAASAGLKAEVKELQAELAALAKSQAEMDSIRSETHAAFSKASEELTLGLGGVRKALGVLREYYGGAAAAFVQQPAVPEHSAATGAGQSIIGILEVVESDFAKDLTAEETEEADAASEYDSMSQENAITKTMKEQDVKYKSQEFNGLDKSVAELNADRDTENIELSAVNEYYSKIKDRCIAKPETYETRAQRRQAEIAGLKEALNILENETAFTQSRKRGGRHGFLRA